MSKRNRNRRRGNNCADSTSKETNTTVDRKDGQSPEGSRQEGGSDDRSAENTPKYNDPAWYTRFPELAFGSGNLPFNEPLGALVKASTNNLLGLFSKLGENSFVYSPDISKAIAVPGVCSLKVKPTYGLSYNRNHPLNVAAQMFYANVRYVNSGRKNYEGADLMLYALAIADLYSFVIWCERLYAYGFMYSQRNYYVNEALIKANGTSKTNLVNNLANFRYWINSFVNKISSYAVPADINLFARRIFMFSHLYTESTTGNIKDQLYQFVPDGFYRFDLDDSGKGKLSYQKLQAEEMTVDVIMSYGESLLDNIFGDEDFGLMSGDIIKAYGSNIIGLSSLGEEALVVPEYEEFVLSQFKNASIVGSPNTHGDGTDMITYTVANDSTVQTAGDIVQDGRGNLVACDFVAGTKIAQLLDLRSDKIITVTNPMPDINDVFEATRLTCSALPVDTNVFHIQDATDFDDYDVTVVCGSEIVVAELLSYYIYDEDYGTRIFNTTISSSCRTLSVDSAREYLLSGMFKWSPILRYRNQLPAVDNVVAVDSMRLISNVDNYTVLTENMIERLHESALLSLTFVPGVSKVVG